MDIESVDRFCLNLPGVTLDLKWQVYLVYSVCDKMFCVRHADPKVSSAVSFKVAPERFLELTDRPGIRPAPYLARAHWVQMESPALLDDATLTHLLAQSYLMVRAKLSKKVQSGLATYLPQP
ncbi:MmcQ/YjbR family DNA-binding protein [Parachitinimonas caeni]|uniref:MmcQ/YjbR family DNA-binding protein n=1 Tax=Parachitinimonas caeni TaxID=3031301 RepID=A0ABT7E280_9NEIS|nr:MmcQ/YjbR family DNA-binding protein [Parachitinimonas caeni]MDK2125022.1 MmcQ/YjbR family DNA-binding protein [Parachitinimonas caeni]